MICEYVKANCTVSNKDFAKIKVPKNDINNNNNNIFNMVKYIRHLDRVCC